MGSDDIPPRHTKEFCNDPSRLWTGRSELGTKVACTLPSPTPRPIRQRQPSDGWSFGDLTEPDVGEPDVGDDHCEHDGNLDWDGESTGLDADAGAALPETWMVAGAAAYCAAVDARIRDVNAQRVTTMFEEVKAVVNRVQGVPELMGDVCKMLQCAWPPHLNAPPACSSTRSTVLDFAGSAVMAAAIAGRDGLLLDAVEDFNRRVNLSVMPVNARIERHSANALPKSKKKKRNRDQ